MCYYDNITFVGQIQCNPNYFPDITVWRSVYTCLTIPSWKIRTQLHSQNTSRVLTDRQLYSFPSVSQKRDFFDFSFYVRYSTLLRLPSLRFHCVWGCWDRTEAGLLRLWHWQSDALTTRLDLIHTRLRLQLGWISSTLGLISSTADNSARSTLFSPNFFWDTARFIALV